MSDTAAERFEIRFSPRLRWLLTAFGMGPRRTGVQLSDNSLRVRAGLFSVEVPRSAIRAVSEVPAPWWAKAGVHTDLRGRWIVNGAPGRLVRLQLSPPATASTAGIRVTIRRLDLGLTDNERLTQMLSADSR
jgi:hypothetical protein